MRAVRGTPVGDDETSAPRAPRRLRWVFAGVALTAYAVDVATKVLAVEKLDGGRDVQVVGEVLQLHLVRNPGAAFSTGTGLTPVISVVAIIATVAVLFYSRRVGTTTWAVALGFLLAGITGNLTDRLLREPGPLHGHVIDFLRLPNWPVFNVADICINVAAGLIIILAFRGVHLDGSRDGDEPDAAADPEPDTDIDDDTVGAEERSE
ncbi:signal peptidase II [Nocardioides dongxiaopingii]|nr:signal peptidase II [Nocardioides sp. S-1144]